MKVTWCSENMDFRNTSVTLGKDKLLYAVFSSDEIKVL